MHIATLAIVRRHLSHLALIEICYVSVETKTSFSERKSYFNKDY